MTVDRVIGNWLLACCLVLFLLVVVGGATRLTGSGLSIVDWRPVTGMVPPLSEAAWETELEKYRTSPQYQQVNRGMSLADFKRIYWWEWGHRQLARFLGLVFALPLAWFWFTGRIRPGLRWPLVGILALGALQGWLGWYMVSSGLVDEPRVSQYRLAAHLSLALIIFSAMFWLALRLRWPIAARSTARPFRVILGFLVLTIVSGAFVAGLKAGYIYNTFPLMGDSLVPPGLLALDPAWRNFTENAVTTQFLHRILGVTTLLVALGLWLWSLGQAFTRAQQLAFNALAAVTTLQATLGVSTLVLQVPVALGTMHQGGAVVLLATVLTLGHVTRRGWSG